uniref:Methylated-DNA--protein-cysteine methyltransferase n=1 Tax=Desulfovibrio desulfuricans (strain ATCC 27774 / DSM 6949 / MB) TaxID=525146 RepID=B8IZY7_DESDA
MKNLWFYTCPIGKIGIVEKNGAICQVFFSTEAPPDGFTLQKSPVIERAEHQLTEYFAGDRKEFDLPLDLGGTEFQATVWQALQTIPAGETRSYKDVAVMIGKPGASRAVGMANNRNPVAIIVPCHRVIGHDGSLTGYAGGLAIKQYLLDHEKMWQPERIHAQYTLF